MPGTHYYMQVYAYGNTGDLMEYCKTNISNVQGLTFEKLDSSGNSLLDINIIGKLNIRTKALFEF